MAGNGDLGMRKGLQALGARAPASKREQDGRFCGALAKAETTCIPLIQNARSDFRSELNEAARVAQLQR
eukprot:8301876-Lingulodinium_polyedra.AAC.1